MRATEDDPFLEHNPDAPLFRDYLLAMGNGELPVVMPTQGIELDPRLLTTGVGELITFVFGDTPDRYTDAGLTDRKKGIMCPSNDTVDSLNSTINGRVAGEEKRRLGADEFDFESQSEMDSCNISIETLNEQRPKGMAQYDLRIKVGSLIILTTNVDVTNGLCNSVRLIITEIHEHYIKARILSGQFEGEFAFITRIDQKHEATTSFPFAFTRRQFPIRLAFAFTINRAQGQTLELSGLFLDQPCFSHGQLYVSLSRVRSFNSIRVFVVDLTAEKGPQGILHAKAGKPTFTQNVVFHQVLRMARAGLK
jgi:hypothetical protein